MLVRRISWKEKSLLKHRAEITTEVRNNFSRIMKGFSDEMMLLARKTKRVISSCSTLRKSVL